MQERTHRQWADEAKFGALSRTACRPCTHVVARSLGIRSSKTRGLTLRSVYPTRTPRDACLPRGPIADNCLVTCLTNGAGFTAALFSLHLWPDNRPDDDDTPMLPMSCTPPTVCKLISPERSFDQRIAKACKSTWTKHVVRGSTFATYSSAETPAATGCTPGGMSAWTAVRRNTAVVRNLMIAAAECGVSRGTSRCRVCATLFVSARILREKSFTKIVDGGIPCARATRSNLGTRPVLYLDNRYNMGVLGVGPLPFSLKVMARIDSFGIIRMGYRSGAHSFTASKITSTSSNERPKKMKNRYTPGREHTVGRTVG
eukprot:6958037-Prymnesium_polylepis.2